MFLSQNMYEPLNFGYDLIYPLKTGPGEAFLDQAVIFDL